VSTAPAPRELIDRDALVARVDFLALVGQRVKLRGKGREHRGACPLPGCPSHGSAHESFAVNADKHLFVCYSCGAAGSPIDYLMRLSGLSFLDACQALEAGPGVGTAASTRPAPGARLTATPPAGQRTPEIRHSKFGPPAAMYRYHDAAGQELGAVARYELVVDGTREKTFLPITWGSEDGGASWRWKLGAWNLPRPLYGLERLAARPRAAVLIVEGEKTAEAARRLLPRFVVVTWPGGSKATSCIDWSPLAGRDVTLWPDADAPGVRAMEDIRALLAPSAARVRWLDVTGQPDTWDAADALAEGWTTDQVIAWARERVRESATAPVGAA
jgi:DNA primase